MKILYYSYNYCFFCRGKFYYALYAFEPEPGENTMMKVEKGQVLRVVQVNNTEQIKSKC